MLEPRKDIEVRQKQTNNTSEMHLLYFLSNLVPGSCPRRKTIFLCALPLSKTCPQSA